MKSKIILLLFLLPSAAAWASDHVEYDYEDGPESQKSENAKKYIPLDGDKEDRACDACGDSKSGYIGDTELIVGDEKKSEDGGEKLHPVYTVSVKPHPNIPPSEPPLALKQDLDQESELVQDYCLCSH